MIKIIVDKHGVVQAVEGSFLRQPRGVVKHENISVNRFAKAVNEEFNYAGIVMEVFHG